jgi:hypothetical protein
MLTRFEAEAEEEPPAARADGCSGPNSRLASALGVSAALPASPAAERTPAAAALARGAAGAYPAGLPAL